MDELSLPLDELTRPGVFRPVTMRDRIVSIDVLRGFAILGILAMNIYAFAMPFAAYNNPLAWGGSRGADLAVWFFTHFLFDQKFLTIFSMLFGAGVILMTQRGEARGARVRGIYYRRQFWLLLMGALHGYLLWFGDILFSYALIAMLVYPLRRLRPQKLLVIGVIWMALSPPISSVVGVMQQKGLVELDQLHARVEAGEELSEEELAKLQGLELQLEFVRPTPEGLQEQVDIHQGGYVGIVKGRAMLVLMMQTFVILFFSLWRVGGLMLIGMAFMKLGVFSARRRPETYRRMLFWGYGLGYPLVAVSAWKLWRHDWDPIYFQISGVGWNYFGSVLVGIGHIALVMMACQRGWFPRLAGWLASVGRMAFTNYLLQSVLGTLIFYGYGLGLYGRVDRLGQMGIVLAIWAFHLWFSPFWMKRFRFGPAEWVWRMLSYKEFPRMRRAEDVSEG